VPRSHEPIAPSEAARAAYGAQQAELVRAVVADGPVPQSFDLAQVRLLAEALLRKRRRAVERTWPALASSLGWTYQRRFDTYAHAHPLIEVQAVSDGFGFLAWLDSTELDGGARTELLAMRARYTTRDGRIRRRRLPFAGWTRLRRSGRLLLVARFPSLGVVSFALPWPALRPQRQRADSADPGLLDASNAAIAARKGGQR
jgi:hypothetical protein